MSPRGPCFVAAVLALLPAVASVKIDDTSGVSFGAGLMRRENVFPATAHEMGDADATHQAKDRGNEQRRKIERQAVWAERIERHENNHEEAARPVPQMPGNDTDPWMLPPPPLAKLSLHHGKVFGTRFHANSELTTAERKEIKDAEDEIRNGVSGMSECSTDSGGVVTRNIEDVPESCRQNFAPTNSGQVATKTGSKWASFCRKVKQIVTPESTVDLMSTLAHTVIWSVSLGLTIAFPPATLAITGGVALLGFITSAATLYKKTGSLEIFKKPSAWCSLFLEVGQNMFIGATGGVGAVAPAILLSADAFEMVVTNFKDYQPLGENLAACSHWDLHGPFDELSRIREDRGRIAQDLLKAIPWGRDPTAGGCGCRDECDGMGFSDVCSDETCLPYWYKVCELEHNLCAIAQDCFGNDHVRARAELDH